MDQKTLFAGYASVKVDPPMGIQVPGYYSKRASDGFLTDLFLRATAFSDGENKAVIISADAIGINASYFDIVKVKIAQRCGIPEEAIFITCTHSHTAYRMVKPDPENDAADIFLNALMLQLCDCAQFAFEDLKPCTMKIASGSVQKVGFVRRYLMKDGSYKTNPGIGNPDVVDYAGVQDESVQLIRFIREGAKEILFVNFGTHADVIGGCKYCADWPGYLAQNLKGALGGEAEIMVIVGAQGDSNHINVFQPKGTPSKGVPVSKRMGRIVAGEVLKLYDDAVDVASEKVAFATKTVKVGKNPYDPADLPEAREIQKIYQETNMQNPPQLKERGYKLNVPEALRILRNLERPEFFELVVSSVQIGNVAFVGFPGEPFMEIGTGVKADSKMDMTFVATCTNGCEGYFPDAASFAVAGYERSASPFAHNCARILTDAGRELVAEMEKI